MHIRMQSSGRTPHACMRCVHNRRLHWPTICSTKCVRASRRGEGLFRRRSVSGCKLLQLDSTPTRHLNNLTLRATPALRRCSPGDGRVSCSPRFASVMMCVWMGLLPGEKPGCFRGILYLTRLHQGASPLQPKQHKEFLFIPNQRTESYQSRPGLGVVQRTWCSWLHLFVSVLTMEQRLIWSWKTRKTLWTPSAICCSRISVWYRVPGSRDKVWK